ncbi:MAG TPA: SPOCS domain-containing protein [Symbiobacteriaceae bacterium]|nr:SPOCS domain-containing protein [Symbiobacteriaceae bacterium]
MPDAVLPLLVGEDSGQVLEDVEVTFPSPAVEIEEPSKRVEIERCETIPGKVIIVGRVVKNIPFKTASSSGFLPGENPRVRIVCGDLRHCTLYIPFRLFIEIPGTREGDNCEIVEACVLGEVDTLLDDNGDGLFERLRETIDIHVRVRVTRDTVVNVKGARRMLQAPMVPFQW